MATEKYLTNLNGFTIKDSKAHSDIEAVQKSVSSVTSDVNQAKTDIQSLQNAINSFKFWD